MAKLPEFKTDEEFAEFVETHDMADYWNEFEEVKDLAGGMIISQHSAIGTLCLLLHLNYSGIMQHPQLYEIIAII